MRTRLFLGPLMYNLPLSLGEVEQSWPRPNRRVGIGTWRCVPHVPEQFRQRDRWHQHRCHASIGLNPLFPTDNVLALFLCFLRLDKETSSNLRVFQGNKTYNIYGLFSRIITFAYFKSAKVVIHGEGEFKRLGCLLRQFGALLFSLSYSVWCRRSSASLKH